MSKLKDLVDRLLEALAPSSGAEPIPVRVDGERRRPRR